MHTPKITATFGDKRLGRKRLLKALAITSAILFCSVTLTGCFKTETEKAEAKCLSGDAVSCVNAAKAYASGKDSKGNSVEKISDKSKQLFLKACTLGDGEICSSIASELDTSFKEIQEGSQTVGRLIAEITSATNEQAQGVDQVNTAVAQMDKVTQQNAATAEESASSAEELSAQATNLNDMVQELVILVEGKGRNVTGGKPHHKGNAGPKKTMKVADVQEASPRRAPGGAPTSSKASGGGMKMLPASEVIPLGNEDDF